MNRCVQILLAFALSAPLAAQVFRPDNRVVLTYLPEPDPAATVSKPVDESETAASADTEVAA